MLRLFNDCIAILLSYIALYLFTKYQWRFGCLFYSLAVSVKMNILLQAPGLLFLLLAALGIKETIICLTICASTQLLLGFPFLSTYPVEYINRSFDLGRVFMFKWTVSYKFLSEEVFISKSLSIALLAFTVTVTMISVEISFNIYPSTWWSSILLQITHISLLIRLYLNQSPHPFIQEIETTKSE
eukprot:gene22481-29110_t